MSILGHPVLRREDPAFLTGGSRYVADLAPEDAAHVVFVRSIAAHARITGIDLADAAEAPGVLAVVSGADLAAELGPVPHILPPIPEAMRRQFLATDTVRFVGEAVAAVVAETREAAVDAAELVVVDTEPLPVVIDPERAADDEVLLFPEHGTNVLNRMATDTTADFDRCEVVVSERIVNQRLTAAPIEARVGLAWWTDEGRLVHYSAVQGAHPTRDLLATIYRLDQDQVRVIVPDVGGGFGAKSRTYADELTLGALSRRVGRPVLWEETRSENIAAMPQGRGQVQRATIGGTRDGRITGYQLDVVQDAGAYPLIGGVLAGMTMRMTTGTYALENVGFTATTTVTNAVPTTAYRGAGRPEATVAIERMIDRYAHEIGMDPVEVRRINLVPAFTEPYTTAVGTRYDTGDYAKALDAVLKAAGYDALRAEQAARRDDPDRPLLGIGVSCYVEITAGAPGAEYGSITVHGDDRVEVTSGCTPYGQGHDTTWSMIVADRTGLPMDAIEVIHGDTDLVPRGGLTVGSRSVQIGGAAIAAAATEVVRLGTERAAELLEAAPGDVTLDPSSGRFHVVGSPAVSVGWGEVAAAGPGPLTAVDDHTPEMPTFPSGAHVAVVEVDRDTGAARLIRLVAADDAGLLVNPLLAHGQVHGGVAQGTAQVLMEEIRYDDDGNLITGTFMDYAVISAAELPSFEVIDVQTPTWVNELGAKGVGESGTIGALPAVYNAVIDAVAHLGIRHLETPVTPEKLWRAMAGATDSIGTA
ncbi:MAG: xanthine dehydrogenase family protein molybdopterin-binding subunit [Acidimicrobiales bacterium]